ncbi:hypothetical protein B0H13DRAFT_2364058 [Mycena leptocephala]|nr:hypothetical protein B0H13DRAFT_2364058 [Mycena leptocephala]
MCPPTSLSTYSHPSCSSVAPFVFWPNHSTIVTHPEGSCSRALRSAQGGKYRKRVAEFLEFFFSAQIAPTVRECKISPASREEENELIDLIFDTLPKLLNRKVFEYRHIGLTPQRLAILQHLRLTTITLELCFGDIGDFAVAPSVPLQEVTFKQGESVHHLLIPQPPGNLHATTTPVLSASYGPHPLQNFAFWISLWNAYSPRVSSQRCCGAPPSSIPYTPPTHFPNTVRSAAGWRPPILKSYRIPDHFSAPILSRRTANRVEIFLPARPYNLGASLVKLDRSPRSVFFTLSTVDIPSGLLEANHPSFLTLASVTIAEPALSSSDLKALLNAVPAHHGLAELTLRAQGRDKLNILIPPDESAADAASCFTKLRTALVKTYSGNQHVLYRGCVEPLTYEWFLLASEPVNADPHQTMYDISAMTFISSLNSMRKDEVLRTGHCFFLKCTFPVALGVVAVPKFMSGGRNALHLGLDVVVDHQVREHGLELRRRENATL